MDASSPAHARPSAVLVALWPLLAAVAALAAGLIAAALTGTPGPWPWFGLAAVLCTAVGVRVGSRLAQL